MDNTTIYPTKKLHELYNEIRTLLPKFTLRIDYSRRIYSSILCEVEIGPEDNFFLRAIGDEHQSDPLIRSIDEAFIRRALIGQCISYLIHETIGLALYSDETTQSYGVRTTADREYRVESSDLVVALLQLVLIIAHHQKEMTNEVMGIISTQHAEGESTLPTELR